MNQACRRRRFEERFQAALERAEERHPKPAVLSHPPRYDEVFEDGVAWLDRLASCDEWPYAEEAEAEG